MRRKKLSRPAQRRVSKKIAKLRREGYPVKQAAAIAYKYARKRKNPELNQFTVDILKKVEHAGDKGISYLDLLDELKNEESIPKGQLLNLAGHMKTLVQTGYLKLIHDASGTNYFTTDKGESLLEEAKNKPNPIQDKDVAECVKALLYLNKCPSSSHMIDKNVLEAIKSEKLWSPTSKKVTSMGKNFLASYKN